jgi:hypothetical protein
LDVADVFSPVILSAALFYTFAASQINIIFNLLDLPA